MVGIAVVVLLFLIVAVILSWYKKVPQGKAIIRTGVGGTKVNFNGMTVVPVLHRMEWMDISVKKVEINRTGKDGLICQDNMRADIKVVFFVRVNPNVKDVIKVAQTIGAARASREETLNQLFEAKFSEGLKTVGRRFDFVDLYDARERFRQEILNTIGTQLNGYILDDAAIDYLEQTPIDFLQDDNILDAEGIKKITDLTARQHIAANKIRNEETKIITQQDVEAKEAILELNRQLAEKQQVQKREIASITAREEAETKKVQEEERLRYESARITTEEELAVAEENKQRQIIISEKAKEKVAAVETERVEKERQLEINERERVVSLAQIEKEKAVEEERKNIQEVIRERVIVEKATVSEEEKIKDTREFAAADREKQVTITQAQQEAEQAKIKQVVIAEGQKEAAELQAKQKLIEADANLKASELEAEAMIKMADASAAEKAASGIAEAQVMEAKAQAKEREGEADAKVIELRAKAAASEIAARAEAQAKEIELRANADEIAGLKEANVLEQTALAEAKGKTANAEALQTQGLAEAKVIEEKLVSEAKGIAQKAEAMKKLDGVGKEHEEFKLKLAKDRDVEMAEINIRTDIATSQALVLAEALKSANIDIVGGEQQFFDRIIQSITQGKSIDRLVDNSETLSEVKANLLDTNGGDLLDKVRGLVTKLGIKSEDIKNLSIAALLIKMNGATDDAGIKGMLNGFLNAAWKAGVAEKPAKLLGL
ncbi:MAG TPA: flotillin family protein [Bacteroidetes bacterium]|nr:flotillin family protein [Bacteroidota bacterium]